jgi:hypothetical protein
VRATRAPFAEARIDGLATAGRPWVLEPDAAHLVDLLREAAADPAGRERRGGAARAAALAYSWEAVAARYRERIAALAGRPPALALPADPSPLPIEDDASLRVLATPAWGGTDRLPELLREWCEASSAAMSASLYLLADPRTAGSPEDIERHVLAAAASAGAALDQGADVTLLAEAVSAERDARVHAAMNAYVPLHDACAGHRRAAQAAGNRVLEPGSGDLARLLQAAPRRAAHKRAAA